MRALIIQNAVAHDEGLGPLWQKRREFWADRAEVAHSVALNPFCQGLLIGGEADINAAAR